MTKWVNKAAALARFRYFRTVWSPVASYHLARMSFGNDGSERLISAIWLASNGIPRSGAAPSMKFKGVKA